MISSIKMRTTSLDGPNLSMELIFNDCSIHGQFHNLTTFGEAIERVMAIRNAARRFGRDLQCHRNLANACVMPDWTMPRAVQALGRDKQRAVMQWLTRHGPFWEDDRRHPSGDWLECNGELVTDTGVGEAAYCMSSGISRGLVSMDPSSWLISPLSVSWRDSGPMRDVDIPNYWDSGVLEAALATAPVLLESWGDLATVARMRFPNLTFASDSFDPLYGQPFAKGAADRLLLRFGVLHHIKGCFNDRGERTSEGHGIYQMHFTGSKSWFSDSSDTEKSAFESELTFPHPERNGETLFCTWHGKVKSPQLRIHFSWPIRAYEPLYVVYVGRKITRR